MRLSKLFTTTTKNIPANEQSRNAQLLIQAGYVYKVMAGVYAYTPLGLRVIENIKQIVREEMNAIDSQELIMTNLQPKDVWEVTGRWSDEVVDVWFKTKLQDDTELGLAWSHEEAIMKMMQQYVKSYKDLPQSVYQFQIKLRNELRAKSGIMRGREFLMKDMYSLHATSKDCDEYYERAIEAYKRCFARFGIGDTTFITFASGGAFTKFSHEFQTICEAGEDVLYINDDHSVAVNEEVLDDAARELDVDKSTLKPVKSAEVGNIFKFGTEKSDKMGIYFTDSSGNQKPFYLASYGIGITRVMGVIVEKMADDKGLVWPQNIAPAKIYLASLGSEQKTIESANEIYEKLQTAGVDVLYDDREIRPGEKFADADLLGIPWRVVISDKTTQKSVVELKARGTETVKLISGDSLLNQFANNGQSIS